MSREKTSPFPLVGGMLFGFHPARSRLLRRCRLAMDILSVTRPRPVAGYISSVSCFRSLLSKTAFSVNSTIDFTEHRHPLPAIAVGFFDNSDCRTFYVSGILLSKL